MASATVKRRPPLLLIGAAAVSAVVLAMPLVYLVVRVADAGPDAVLAALWRMRTLDTVLTSLSLVVLVVLGALLLGVPTAFFLGRTRVPLRALFLVLAALPLAIPSYVAAYAWIALFPGMSGIFAAALVMSLATFPYIAIPLTAVLRRSDAGMEEAARSLGLSPWSTAFRVTLPLAWPAAAAGSLLVALYTLAEFGTVAIFRVDAFTRVIYASYRASFDRTAAAVLAVMLVVLAMSLVIAEARARGKAARWRVGSGTQRPALPIPLTRGTMSASMIWLIIVAILSLGVPITSLTVQLLRSQSVSFEWDRFAGALSGSVVSAGLGAVIALALALPVGILAARYRGRLVRTIDSASFLGHGLPGVVVGLALVFLTISLLPAVYQTLITLAFAYAVLFAPKAIGSTRSAVAAVSPDLESMARSLGKGAWSAWWATTGRLAWPGIAAGGLLVLLTAMKELPATLMLRPTGFETLATRLWSRTEVGAFGEAAPYALGLILLAAVPAWLMGRWIGQEGEQREESDHGSPRSIAHNSMAHNGDPTGTVKELIT